MGREDKGLQSSYDYIGEQSTTFIKEKVAEMNPFAKDRTTIELMDKSFGLSPFTNMSNERLDKFVKRGKCNYMRNYSSQISISSASEDS